LIPGKVRQYPQRRAAGALRAWVFRWPPDLVSYLSGKTVENWRRANLSLDPVRTLFGGRTDPISNLIELSTVDRPPLLHYQHIFRSKDRRDFSYSVGTANPGSLMGRHRAQVSTGRENMNTSTDKCCYDRKKSSLSRALAKVEKAERFCGSSKSASVLE